MTTDKLTKDDFTDEQINDIVQSGDVGSLDPNQRSRFLYRLAEKLKLNPFSRPFDLIHVKKGDGSKKLIIYANKSCADQIRERDNLSIEPLYFGPLMIGDTPDETIYVFHVRISNSEGRAGFNVGAVPIVGTDGDDRSNAIMKAYTKAERRATLAFSGMGFPDESEISSIKAVEQEKGGEGKPQMHMPKAIEAEVRSAPLPRATPDKPPVKVHA
jgi:hypothetical protein